MKLVVMLALVLSAPVLVEAQSSNGPAAFTPPAPTSADLIRARFLAPGCGLNASTSVSGNTVTTTVSVAGCIPGPPTFFVPFETQFGPLPPGNYTYEIYYRFEDDEPPTTLLRSTQPLVIAVAASATSDVPSLSFHGLAALVLAVVIVGTVALR
jgi:hypothetical protein